MELSEGGLPKVEGLQALLQEPTATDKGAQQQEAQPTSPQGPQPPEPQGQTIDPQTDIAGVLKSFRNPDGSVRVDDLAKSYKESVGWATRTSQEKKAIETELANLKEQNRQYQEEIQLRNFQPQPQAPQKSFEEMFIENPEMAITMKANEISLAQRIQEVAQEEYSKNPNEYMDRQMAVQRLAQNPRFAPLSTSPQGVRKLFEIADTVRKQTIQRTVHNAITQEFGEGAMDVLRSLLANKSGATQPNNPPTNTLNAYMPPTGTSYRTGQNIDNAGKDIAQRKEEAIKKGNVGGVARALLDEALNR